MINDQFNKQIPKTAVIGAAGYIGSAFLAEYRKVFPECVGTSRKTGEGILLLDLSAPDISALKLKQTGHKDALILAGIAGIKECEEHPDATRKINVDGTLKLIEQLVNEGIKPVFFSTDYVFDGKCGAYSDTDRAFPVTEYGRQKAAVEAAIPLLCGENYLIVRLSKVFGLEKNDGTLLDEMAGKFHKGEVVKAAYDQIFCPTLLSNVVGAVSFLQSKGTKGTVNLCSPETWARYDLAVSLAEKMGKDTAKVKKISLDEVNAGIRRPKNTSMIASKVFNGKFVFTPMSDCINIVAKNWR
jgi:dTDP-4-dehydrorhamnose reductase